MSFFILRNIFLFVLLNLGLSFSACTEKVDKDELMPELVVTLDKEIVNLEVDGQIEINALFGNSVVPKRSYRWSSSNPDVAVVEEQGQWRVKVTAKSEGTAVISIRSSDQVVSATCTVSVKSTIEELDGPTRILAIGNSFSADALEAHLHGLAVAANKEIVIGNLFIGGALLSLHWENASANKPAYSYVKIDKEGVRTTRAGTSIATALMDEPWDYISFQQASPSSGQYSTYVAPLPLLYNYVKSTLGRDNVKYIFHQTWAYAQNSTHSGFANYSKDQMVMYNAIVNAVNQAKNLVHFDHIVPAGTAIQNGRTSVVGDNFCRDGYHLDYNIGRYTAAAAWYETLFGKSVIGNTYKPTALSSYEAEIAQHAAHYAVQDPNKVTELVEFQHWNNTDGPATDMLIDFGENSSSNGWNSFSSPTLPFTIPDLRNRNGAFSGIGVELVERFNSRNINGPTSTTISGFIIPGYVSSNSYYGNTKAIFLDVLVPKSVLRFTGFDKTKQYNFCFFGSRMSVTDNRETSYTVLGQNTKTVYLNSSANTSHTVCADIYPDANGEILVTITAGPNNSSPQGFYYLNAMKISPKN